MPVEVDQKEYDLISFMGWSTCSGMGGQLVRNIQVRKKIYLYMNMLVM